MMLLIKNGTTSGLTMAVARYIMYSFYVILAINMPDVEFKIARHAFESIRYDYLMLNSSFHVAFDRKFDANSSVGVAMPTMLLSRQRCM